MIFKRAVGFFKIIMKYNRKRKEQRYSEGEKEK